MGEMKNNKIQILAEFKIFDNNVEQAKELFNELAKCSLKEPDCLIYDVKQDSKDGSWFIINEAFHNQDAFDYHKTTKHYFEILKNKLESLIVEKRVRFLI
jgi:quinol monooxygenase YgiN